MIAAMIGGTWTWKKNHQLEPVEVVELLTAEAFQKEVVPAARLRRHAAQYADAATPPAADSHRAPPATTAATAATHRSRRRPRPPEPRRRVLAPTLVP